MQLATKTLNLINRKQEEDGGAAFRVWQERTLPAMGDAYSGNTFPFRSHLGASGIGNECSRAPWFDFRWATLEKVDPRMQRLFNRGHLEEARFIALLLMIGAEVYQQDEHGNQFRISDAGGHFGGSGDGIVVNIPDLPPGQPGLCEFKTSSDAQFKKMVKQGVKKSKYVHYVQMQVYMKKMGIYSALYMVVNKNNDELYAEIVIFDQIVADQYINLGVVLVSSREPPEIPRGYGPSYYKCKNGYCKHYTVCHYNEAPYKTCRSCSYVNPNIETGKWDCLKCNKQLTKEEQFKACENYTRLF